MRPRPPGVWESLRQAWDGPAVTGIGLLILAPGMLVTDARFTMVGGGGPAERAGAAILAYLALVVVIVIGSALALRRLAPGPIRRVAVVLIFGAGALARVVVIAFATPDPGPSTLEPWMIARFASTLIWLNAAAVIIDWQQRAARQSAQRNAELQRLSETVRMVDDELARTTAELVGIRRRIADELSQLSDELDEPNADIRGVADRVGRAVDDLVRPTSHDLVREPVADISVPAVTPQVLSWTEQARVIAVSWPVAWPFQPMAVAAVSLPIGVAAILARPLGPSTLANLVVLGVQIALVWLASVVLTPVLRIRAGAWPIAIVAVSYGLLLVVGVWLGALVSSAAAPRLPEVSLLPWVATVATGGAAALSASWAANQRETQEAIDETEWRLRRARQHLWAQRRRLAITLHGRVQATLAACHLLLHTWLQRRDRAGGDEVFDRVRAGLRSAATLDEGISVQAVDERVTELGRIWAGIVDVSIQWDEESMVRLAADPDGSDAVVETIRELLLNAVRHGKATIVGIRIGVDGPRTVGVDVEERHDATEEPAHRIESGGVGLALLQSLALDLAIEESAGRRLTRVTFAAAR